MLSFSRTEATTLHFPRLPASYALVFDMDGVVIDSNALHTSVWEEYLAQLGVIVPDLEERMLGKRNDQIVRLFLGEHLDGQEVFQHGANKEALFRERMRPHVADKLTPGLRELLAFYAGTPTGLATNAERANVDFVLDSTGLRSYFSVMVDGHQVTHPKPHPEIYLKVAGMLGIPPHQCVVFEDSATGLQAAHDAGTRVVAISGVQSKYASSLSAEVVIENFNDSALVNWLHTLS